MALKDIKKPEKKEENVTITLGGVEYPLRFPVRAFRDIQEKFGGWPNAWTKMAHTDAKPGEPLFGEVDYDVLAELLAIGIHQEDMTVDKVATALNDMMQDEVVPIITSLLQARNKWAPEPEDKTKMLLDHLEKAEKILEETGRLDDSGIVGAIKERLERETESPTRKTA